MNARNGIFGIAAMALLALTQQSYAADTSYSVNLVGYVPVICKVDAGALASGQAAATLTEFCNSPNGYQVWVDYQPGTDGAQISVDGRTIALSSSGSTLIDSSATAARYVRAVDLNGASNLSAISFRIVPASV